MAPVFSSRVLVLLALALPSVLADGVGLLGYGKWLYRPLCAHTCRYLLASNPIPCQSEGNDAASAAGHSHHSATSDVHCWLTDLVFLKSVALCIEDYCPMENPQLSTIERWWSGHLATGTIGDWSDDMVPILSYGEAARLAGRDADEAGPDGLPWVVELAEINATSRIPRDYYLPNYNFQKSFQWGEFDHSTNSLVIAITSVGLPVFLSMFRFLPGWSRRTSRLAAMLDQPAWGRRHRTPVWGGVGYVPTRGQSLLIAYLVIINVVLMCLPARTIQPNARMTSHHMQRVQMIGDRAGALAFCLYLSLFLFGARNNILIWVTGWSHGTFLLLHRWIGYLCIFQTVMHSVLLLHYFVQWGDHASESQLPYWYWGIISTLATCLIYPLSLLPVRRTVYQFFLATHQVLAALVLISAFLHIWYLYEWNWGYEIWIYMAGAVWFLDRALRLVRISSNGLATAEVSTIGPDSDLLRVEIHNVTADGHVYLYFPTLSWRFWEAHPFSVLSASADLDHTSSTEHIAGPLEEKTSSPHITSGKQTVDNSAREQPASDEENPEDRAVSRVGPRAAFLIRPQAGSTAALLARARRAAGGRTSLPVLIESSYHSNPALQHLSSCSTLVAIAGGVGITAILPVLRSFPGPRAHLWWGAKNHDVVEAVQPELSALKNDRIDIHVSVGSRLALEEILREELLADGQGGEVAVVVCGPPEMADDARKAVGDCAGSGPTKTHVVFVDEAFSW